MLNHTGRSSKECSNLLTDKHLVPIFKFLFFFSYVAEMDRVASNR